MDISWDDARLFLAIAEAGSVSAAARSLRVAQPTVSRRLRELEDALGFALFDRAHGGTTLTTRGERLLEPARKMAEWAAELERAAENKLAKPSGLVRVTAPPGVAFDFLAPFAAWLRTKQRDLRLEVLSSVEYLDLARGAADLAIRLRAPQRDLVVIARAEQIVAAFASKAYAARLPKKPSLADVDWVAWAPPFEKLSPTAEMAAAMPGFVPSFTADDFLVQLAAAEAGAGAIVLGTLRHRFSSSALVQLDIDFARFPKSTLYLVAAKSALAIPRIRAVADLLANELHRNR
jgi:molybdate transport repressor ModE-like protein